VTGVRETYDALAPAYDLLTGAHDHVAWAAQLEELARRAGLSGRRLLDVGCGTGSSALPMLARGYDVVGVDVSPGMLTLAREKLGQDVRLELADMRRLPVLGAFDLVWSVADGVNYLAAGELVSAFEGFRRNLAPDGLVVFDVDTLASFRLLYSSLIVVPGEDRIVVLEGQAPPDLDEGASATARVEYLELESPPWWRRTRFLHRQHHHPPATLERALTAAGLQVLAVWGTDGAGASEVPLDEERHNKAVYIASAGRG
jgi:ubiquinone/menaquinone biosynthesis C-methylase UbiE